MADQSFYEQIERLRAGHPLTRAQRRATRKRDRALRSLSLAVFTAVDRGATETHIAGAVSLGKALARSES